LTNLHASSLEIATEIGINYFIRSFRTLNNNEIKNFTITASIDPPTIGIAFDVTPESQVMIEVFRVATLNATPGGTILTLVNANEALASVNVAATVIREDPTIDADGNLIADALMGTGKNQVAVQGNPTNIINLGKSLNTTLIRLTSGSSSNTTNFELRIIEEI